MLRRTSGLLPKSTSSRVLLSLLLFIIVLWSSLLDGAHAGNLPPTITNGTYTSTDDTILAAGTSLNVTAMLADAVTNSQTGAVCTLLRTTFNGTLTITLPSTAAAWTTTNNISLRLLIQDGTTSGKTAPWPTTYINIAGVLVFGSSITVLGGDYDYSDQFIDLPSGISIQDGSSVTIRGGTYRLHYPSSGTQTFFMRSNGAITVHRTSTLAILNNIMVVSNASYLIYEQK